MTLRERIAERVGNLSAHRAAEAMGVDETGCCGPDACRECLRQSIKDGLLDDILGVPEPTLADVEAEVRELRAFKARVGAAINELKLCGCECGLSDTFEHVDPFEDNDEGECFVCSMIGILCAEDEP